MVLTEPILKDLIRSLHNSVIVVAKDIIVSQDKAEDIAMIVWQIIWERKDKFESVDKVKAFLYIAAKNLAYQWKKGENNQKRLILENLVTDDNYEIHTDHVAKDLFKRCLKLVSEKFNSTYFCIFTSTMDGKSNTQIAKELGINSSTVTSARSRIMNFLRAQFADDR